MDAQGYILCGSTIPLHPSQPHHPITMRFEDTPLDLALRALFTSMKVDFVIPDELARYRVNASFKNTYGDEILTSLSKIYPFKIYRSSKIYTVVPSSSP